MDHRLQVLQILNYKCCIVICNSIGQSKHQRMWVLPTSSSLCCYLATPFLPTDVYPLRCTLVTPKNATHYYPLVNMLATPIQTFRYRYICCCRRGLLVVIVFVVICLSGSPRSSGSSMPWDFVMFWWWWPRSSTATPVMSTIVTARWPGFVRTFAICLLFFGC
jgi:hypothetical protein